MSTEKLHDDAFVVESLVQDPRTGRQGIARVYVRSEEKAKRIVSELPSERTYRCIPLAEIKHEAARENILRARIEEGITP